MTPEIWNGGSPSPTQSLLASGGESEVSAIVIGACKFPTTDSRDDVGFLGSLPLSPRTKSKPVTPWSNVQPHQSSSVHALAAPPHRTSYLALRVPRGEVLALVVVLLTLGQGELDLGVPVVEVDRERHQGETVLAQPALHLADLVTLEQQLAHPARLVVGPGALGVLGDVHAVQEDFAVALVTERVDQRRTAGPQRLDLGAGQRHAGLDGVEDRVVVARLAVRGHDLAPLLPWHAQQLQTGKGPAPAGPFNITRASAQA